MRLLTVAVGLLFTAKSGESPLRRSIDHCAQDGLYFYSQNDNPTQPIQVERDGITIRIEHPDAKSADAVLTFSREKQVLIQKQKDFEDSLAWLAISKNAFATTWKPNASSARSQLFLVRPTGEIVENTDLIPAAERTFSSDAKRVCKNPGNNTTAIKWVDDDHLLLAINAWASGICYSNFTEGFILSISKHQIEKKLSEQELINLPAVCTWNLVSAKHR